MELFQKAIRESNFKYLEFVLMNNPKVLFSENNAPLKYAILNNKIDIIDWFTHRCGIPFDFDDNYMIKTAIELDLVDIIYYIAETHKYNMNENNCYILRMAILKGAKRIFNYIKNRGLITLDNFEQPMLIAIGTYRVEIVQDLTSMFKKHSLTDRILEKTWTYSDSGSILNIIKTTIYQYSYEYLIDNYKRLLEDNLGLLVNLIVYNRENIKQIIKNKMITNRVFNVLIKRGTELSEQNYYDIIINCRDNEMLNNVELLERIVKFGDGHLVNLLIDCMPYVSTDVLLFLISTNFKIRLQIFEKEKVLLKINQTMMNIIVTRNDDVLFDKIKEFIDVTQFEINVECSGYMVCKCAESGMKITNESFRMLLKKHPYDAYSMLYFLSYFKDKLDKDVKERIENYLTDMVLSIRSYDNHILFESLFRHKIDIFNNYKCFRKLLDYTGYYDKLPYIINSPEFHMNLLEGYLIPVEISSKIKIKLDNYPKYNGVLFANLVILHDIETIKRVIQTTDLEWYNYYALRLSIRQKDFRIAEMIKKHIDIEKATQILTDFDILCYLTNALPRLDQLFNHGIYTNNKKVVEFCLKKGVNPNTDDMIHTVFNNKQYRIMELLIKYGAVFNHHNERYLRILTGQNRCKGLIETMIKKGANIHIFGDQPLVNAIESNNIPLIKMLVRYGANVHVNNDNILIPLCRYGEHKLLKKLLNNYEMDITANDSAALEEYTYDNGHYLYGKEKSLKVIIEYIRKKRINLEVRIGTGIFKTLALLGFKKLLKSYLKIQSITIDCPLYDLRCSDETMRIIIHYRKELREKINIYRLVRLFEEDFNGFLEFMKIKKELRKNYLYDENVLMIEILSYYTYTKNC